MFYAGNYTFFLVYPLKTAFRHRKMIGNMIPYLKNGPGPKKKGVLLRALTVYEIIRKIGKNNYFLRDFNEKLREKIRKC